MISVRGLTFTILEGTLFALLAKVRLLDGTIRTAEVHWYEATGMGRKEFKIQRLLNEEQ